MNSPLPLFLSDSETWLFEEVSLEEDSRDENEENSLQSGLRLAKAEESSIPEPHVQQRKRMRSGNSSFIANRSRNRLLKLLRIPKNDIRRKYPLMFLNTFNSMDNDLLSKFVSMFLHPQTVYKRQIMSPLNPNLESSSVSFNGPVEIFSYLHLIELFGPDRVIKLDSSTIVTRSNTYLTEIRLDCTFEVHYLYDWDATRVQTYIYKNGGHLSSGIASMSPDILPPLEEGLSGHFPYIQNPRGYRFHPTFKLLIYNVYSADKLDEILFQVPSIGTLWY